MSNTDAQSKVDRLMYLKNIEYEIYYLLNSIGYSATPERALAIVLLAFDTIYQFIGDLDKAFDTIVSLLIEYINRLKASAQSRSKTG